MHPTLEQFDKDIIALKLCIFLEETGNFSVEFITGHFTG